MGQMIGRRVAMADMPLRPGHYRVLVAASLGQMIGTALATVIGVVLPMMEIACRQELSPLTQGIVGCSALVGICVGAAVFGPVCDRWGYLTFFRLCPALVAVAAVAAVYAGTVPALVACLFVMGFGIGGEYCLDSDYISEIMPRRWRAFMVGVAKATSSLGNIVAAAMCLWLLGLLGKASAWPGLFWIVAGLAVVMVALRLRFAESPQWLLNRGEVEAAGRAARRLLGPGVDVGRAEEPSNGAGGGHGLSMWRFVRENALKVMVSGVPWACEGLGVYGIGVFLPVLVMALGLERFAGPLTSAIDHVEASVRITLWISCVILPGFAIGLALIDRVYKIWLITVGFIGSGLSLLALLTAYRLGWPAWVSIAAFMGFELFLNLGPHLVTFVLPPLIYDVDRRGRGAGIAASMGKMGAVAGVLFIPSLLKVGGVTLVLLVSVAVMWAGGLITGFWGRRVLPRGDDAK